MSLAIVAATQADIPDILRLNLEVQSLHVSLAPQIFLQDCDEQELFEFWRTQLNTPRHKVRLAKMGDSIVGYLWFELQEAAKDAVQPAAHEALRSPHWRRRIGASIGRGGSPDSPSPRRSARSWRSRPLARHLGRQLVCASVLPKGGLRRPQHCDGETLGQTRRRRGRLKLTVAHNPTWHSHPGRFSA